MFYTESMIAPFKTPPPTLSVRIGSWFEASATGWGVVAVPLTLLLAMVAPLIAKLL